MRAIQNSPFLASALTATAVMLIGSVLPVWIVWRVFPESWCVVGESGTLWEALIWFPQHLRVDRSGLVWNVQMWNIVGLAILCSLSAAVGAIVYIRRRRRLAERNH